MGVLRNLSLDAALRPAILKQDVVALCVRALARGPAAPPGLLEGAAACLTNLASEEAARQAMLSRGALPPAIAALESEDEAVARAAAGLISALCLGDDVARGRALGDERTLLALVGLLSSESAESAEQAGAALTNLAAGEAAAARIAAGPGALLALVTAAQHEDAGVAEAAAACLTNLAVTTRVRDTIVRHSDAVAALSAMLSRPEAGALEQACAALANLLARGHGPAAEQLKQAGGLPLLQALRGHAEPRVGANAALALAGLPEAASNRAATSPARSPAKPHSAAKRAPAAGGAQKKAGGCGCFGA